jgi:filamentous hemagglutinin family protein
MQNKLNTKWRWLRLIFLLLSILFPLRIAIATGGIATDGTVGPAQRLSGPEVDIDQRLGTTVGKNLFHSFSEFNVNNGQTVTFRENTPNALDNVISRVTGGSRSDINGTLRSTPDGHANLYLVNPAGVMFGKNARIDVPGAFHASTADEVRFQDGAKFSASQPAGSTLTAAAPASFGFLGTSTATNGLLKVDGAQLAVRTGKKLDMVGRNITVENGAKLSAPSGEVRLEAVGQGSMNVPVNQPSEIAHGVLTLTRSSTIDASGEGGGKVIVRGRDLNMDQNAKILAKTNGKENGAGIDVRLTGDMNMKRGNLVQAGTTGNGASGKILVIAKNLRIDGQNTVTGINTETGDHTAKEEHSTGRAGDIELRIGNKLSLARSGQINASSFGTGDAGNITVKAGQLLIDGQEAQNLFQTGIFSIASKSWSGQGGDIAVDVQGDLNMIGGGSLIQAGTISERGASGNIWVTAKNLRIDGQNTITGIGTEAGSSTAKEQHSTGRAGDIELRIGNKLSLARGGQINSSSYSMGNAGNVMVKAGQLLIDTKGVLTDILENSLETGIFTAALRTWSGRGGNIDVHLTDDMDIKGGGLISAITYGNRTAGSIVVNAQSDINLKGGSIIEASTRGRGYAGNISVTAKNLLIDGQAIFNDQPLYFGTGIASETGDSTATVKHLSGRAGDITLHISDQLSLVRGGQISSRTFGTGAAGKISVTAGQLSIEPQGILASLDNLGNSLETGIFTSALRTWSGKGGNIDVHLTYDMDIKGGGLISAISHGANDAGNVTVSANQLTLEQDSFISTAAESSNGGNITINGGQLVQLIKSKLITNVQGLQGNSGNITINAENLVMETGLIQANTKAFGATAGNIKLNIKGLIPSGQSLFKGLIQETPWTSDVFGLNVIEAVAPNGISGLIQSTAPQLDLSGVLSNLGIPQFDVYAISQDYCSLGTGSTLIRQGKGGLPLRSRDSVLY